MNKKQIITERHIIDAWKKGIKIIDIEQDAIITPQAKDSAKVKKIEFVLKSDREKPVSKLLDNRIGTVVIGCDHAGFRLKETIKKYLVDKKIVVVDIGTNSEEACDYPDFAYKTGMAIKENKADFGIMIDGVGVASAMVANKIPGIRAACCTVEFMARSSREHNNANILTLGSRVIGEELAKSIVDVFLTSKFLEGKHLIRIEKIRDLENKFMK